MSAPGGTMSGGTMLPEPVEHSSIRVRLAVVGLVVVGLMFTSVLPMRRYFDFRRHIAQLYSVETTLNARKTELQTEALKLKTPAEIERRAREDLGMVRPGEVAFAIVTPAAAAAPVGEASERAASSMGLFARWWHAVSHAVAAPI